MKRCVGLALLLLSTGAGVGCSSSGDDDDSAPSGNAGSSAVMPSTGAGNSGRTAGSSSGSTAGGGSSKYECVNSEQINLDCPFNLPPISGTCAPAGTCCHRASNTAKIAKLGPDDPAQIEYRLNFVDITNQPLSVGNPVL